MFIKYLLLFVYTAVVVVSCFSFDYINRNEFIDRDSSKFDKGEYEVVFLPVVLPKREAITENGQEIDETLLEFTAFGRPISLQMRENTNLRNYKMHIQDGDNSYVLPSTNKTCLFLHKNPKIVASISTCQQKSVTGFIFVDNSTLEISPLSDEYKEALMLSEPLLEFEREDHHPHIVRKVPDVSLILNDVIVNRKLLNQNYRHKYNQHFGQTEAQQNELYTLEVGLFFDEAAYKIFAPYSDNNDEQLRDMLLAYLNGVQALYHHPSLGTPLEIVLVRLDIMKRQPVDMPTYNGERSQLLNSFCAYQNSINPSGDDDPEHWDMGLYISGLDFFAYENGKRDGATMGLATVGGVCYGQYSCIIAEFGTTNIFGKPYPSAGFTSVYILAHEIGHNLGMHHDSKGNNCPKEGYIMSPSRGTQGETQWSSCSAQIMLNLGSKACLKDEGVQKLHDDHSKFLDAPGQTYTAKRQCEILLTDKDAYLAPNQDSICQNLRCKTPHRSGYYFAGPALEGTECNRGMYCNGGDCVRSIHKPIKVKPGGWSPWKDGLCNSGCIVKSRGFQTRNRECNNPRPVNTDKGCEGPSYETVLCKDTQVCSARKTVIDYASDKCKQYSELIPELDRKGAGLQSPHEPDRIWMGCAIFCRKNDGTYYTPRMELNDLGVSPYFPDGSWCHREGGQDYYCLKHHCLPENFKFTKSWPHDEHDSFNFLQNALPKGNIPEELIPYFSLGTNGKPLDVDDIDIKQKKPKDEEWELNDYLLLPDQKLNEI